ncbi:MAG: GNAT family N-acetyltransferase [Patescibacteria group bacterium]
MSERILLGQGDLDKKAHEEVPVGLLENALLLKNREKNSAQAVRAWIAGDQNRLAAVEVALAEKVQDEHEISFATLELLGEIEQERGLVFVNEKLAWNLEMNPDLFSGDAVRYIQENIRGTNPEANLAFHKFLDFVHQQAVTVQDPPLRQKLNSAKQLHSRRGFFLDFCYLAERELPNCRNYLIQKHVQDILETWRQAGSKKKGALPGIAGGASDQTIYTFSHVGESYRNALKLGINRGYPLAHPVLPISPGYYAQYSNGIVEDVYREQGEVSIEEKERQYISQNDPSDEYIYDEINSFNRSNPGPNRRGPSNGLPLFQNIWDFDKHLKASGRTFYYDISRITNTDLHPVVVGDFYTRNQQYRHTLGEKENTSQPISYDDFMRQLYPAGELTEEKLYHYKNLSKLHMRKKIEDDFGFDLSQSDLWTQRMFLEFLETRDIENVQKLQKFVKEFGSAGLKTFLSLEYGPEFGDDIIALGEKLPKAEAEKIFAKYGELVDATTEAETALRENFPKSQVTPELVSAARESLLKKGRDMLVSFSAQVKASGQAGQALSIPNLERELELLRGNAALFAVGFKELSMRGEKLNLAEIKGDVTFEQGVSPETFSPADRERMKELYRINYAKTPIFQKKLIEGFDRVLNEPDNQFYVLRYGGVIEGFYRLEITPQDTLYFGAFNLNPKYAGSGIGEALMRQSLDVRAKEAIVKASCTATLPIASNYIERGFVGTKTEQVDEVYSMNIIRHDTKENLFRSKDLTEQQIMETCETTSDFVCRKVPLGQLSSKDFSLLEEQATDGASQFVLTRYIRDKQSKQNASAYLVFEKTTQDTLDNFSTPEKPLRFSHQE